MYAQSNYQNVPQGIPPTKYTIAQVGCFITSFCNLIQRFGGNVDPPAINAWLRDRGVYIDVDDGVRDDVAWDTITKFDPNIVVTKLGDGVPASDNSIVKFVYNGGRSTHFCLVLSAANGTIIDSWDGKVKSWNAYPGGPVAYASYNKVGLPAERGVDMTVVKPWREGIVAYYQDFLDENPSEQQIKDQMGQADMRNVAESLRQEVRTKREALYKEIADLKKDAKPLPPGKYIVS